LSQAAWRSRVWVMGPPPQTAVVEVQQWVRRDNRRIARQRLRWHQSPDKTRSTFARRISAQISPRGGRTQSRPSQGLAGRTAGRCRHARRRCLLVCASNSRRTADEKRDVAVQTGRCCDGEMTLCRTRPAEAFIQRGRAFDPSDRQSGPVSPYAAVISTAPKFREAVLRYLRACRRPVTRARRTIELGMGRTSTAVPTLKQRSDSVVLRLRRRCIESADQLSVALCYFPAIESQVS